MSGLGGGGQGKDKEKSKCHTGYLETLLGRCIYIYIYRMVRPGNTGCGRASVSYAGGLGFKFRMFHSNNYYPVQQGGAIYMATAENEPGWMPRTFAFTILYIRWYYHEKDRVGT